MCAGVYVTIESLDLATTKGFVYLDTLSSYAIMYPDALPIS
jgi:hypothetical protein